MYKCMPCIPDLFKTFNMIGYWVLSIFSSASLETIMCCFSLFANMVGYIDLFSYIKPLMHTWDEAYFVMIDDTFDMFLYLVYECFLRTFKSMFKRKTVAKYSFFVELLCVVGVTGWLWSHRMHLAVSFLFLLCRIVWGVLVLFLLCRSDRILCWKHVDLGGEGGQILMSASISLGFIGLYK